MRMSEADVLATVRQVTVTRLEVWVREGWVVPTRREDGAAEFDELDVARLRLVCQLKDELNVNDDAIPVVLSLLDQVYGLRRELKALAGAVDRQPERVRAELLEALAAVRTR